MINDEELRISNKSYVNKDFGVIYPEVLDTTKTLTDRWDPETSNESDPGIVLLKLLSFIADKNNYNIDKNALENFMLSATQESSMRKLCDMMGYSMNYYVAPSVKLTISYLGEGLNNKGEPISFKALSTVFGSSDENETVEYVLIQDCNLQESNKPLERIALQGKLKVLNVNTSGTETSTNESLSTIQLSNLDDNNRIYFPETNVAQNGVFVISKDKGTSSDFFWKVVDNLNYYTYPNNVFKFGFDSIRNLPYIEFPNYIASIIGSGLYINYIVTDGVDGDVKAKVINSLISSTFDWEESEFSKDNLYVRNASSSFGGANPESINSAYNGFKKTIGTFNTLVTCRDYANAIYNMYDSTNSFPLVSNVQVCDRRDDFNYSQRVVSYDDSGEATINVTPSDELSAYDLCCYTLKPIYNFSKPEYFNDSFKPLTVDGSTLTSTIKNNLETNKTISHDYKDFSDTEIVYLFKNMLGLSAKIVTKYKVNTNEQVEILNNIKMNLIKSFNAREVDYGVEIPYESLVSCIESADERISQVILDEPSLKTRVMNRDGDECDLISSEGKNAYLQLLVQNILNGNISLFEFDDDFNFDLGESQIDDSIPMVNKEIDKLSTYLNMTVTSSKETLKKNEVIQIVYPSIVTELPYPAYCYYRFKGNGTTIIPINVDYTLKANEILYMSYTKDDGTQICKEYAEGTIVRPIGRPIYDYRSVGSESTKSRELPNGESALFVTMPNANQSIEIRKENTTEINTRTQCYWLLNNENNEITFDDYTLKEGEYFFYTDASHTQLIALGSGTTLSSDLLGKYSCDRVSVEEVFENGLSALESKWQFIPFASHKLTITENSIITLTENDSICVKDDDESSLVLSNELSPIGDINIEYTFAGEDPVTLYGDSGIEYKIKSRLDISVAKDEPQVIDTTHGQKIEVEFRDSSILVLGQSSSVETNGAFFNFNAPLQLSGQENINMIVNVVDESGASVPTYPYSIYCYNEQIEDNENVNPSINPGRSSLGYASYELSSIGDGGYLPALTFDLPVINGENAILMIHINMIDAQESDVLTLSVPSNCCYEIRKYNQGSYGNSLDMHEGINVIDILYKGSETYSAKPTLTISKSNSKGGVLTLGTLDFIKDYNSALGIDAYEEVVSGDIIGDLLQKIRDIDTQGIFYYNNKIENSKIIESSNLLSPYAFYDVNNRANKITMSQIDFGSSNYNIEIIRSSRL